MNASAHRLTAGAAVGIFLAKAEKEKGQATVAPLAGGLLASFFTMMPDLLEPATSPSHRQFFHSIVFAAALITVFRRLSDWEVKSATEELWKNLGKLAIAGYLIHLALDATTAKSLPIIGKI